LREARLHVDFAEVTDELLARGDPVGGAIALALLEPASPEEPQWAEGTSLDVDVRGRTYPMRVVAAPFYRRPR